MPRFFRSMTPAADGLPVAGASARSLGVRLPPDPAADVDIDPNGYVARNGRGMSVVDNWRSLPRHRIPRRLSHLVAGAVGSSQDRCWRHGNGNFQNGVVNPNLEVQLKPGSETGANVVPSAGVTPADFQAQLAATRADWVVDET